MDGDVVEIHLYECEHVWQKTGGKVPEKCPVCELETEHAAAERQATIYRDMLQRSGRTTPEVDLRPEVVWFAQQMERVLRENDHKGGWDNWFILTAFQRLEEEAHELGGEISRYYLPTNTDEQRAAIIKEAVDVANFAMMIADLAQAGK